MSSFEAQALAIRTRFDAGWVPGNWTPAVSWYPANQTAAADRSFVRLAILPATTSLESVGQIGSALSPVIHRYLGVIVVQCMTEPGTGETQALQMADDALEIFRGVTDPGITYHGPNGQAGWST